MNHRRTSVCLAIATCLACPGFAHAALDTFLKFDGPPNGVTIKGESLDPNHPGWSDVSQWSWGISATPNIGTGTGAGVSKPVLDDFTWSQGLDSSVPGLFVALGSGGKITSATLDVVKASGGGGPSQSFFQMIFSPVFPTSLSLSGADELTIDGALTYDKVTMRYRAQDAKGAFGAWMEGSFSRSSGKTTFTGNQQVLLGLFQAGGAVQLAALPPLPSPVPEPGTTALMALGLLGLAGVARRRRS